MGITKHRSDSFSVVRRISASPFLTVAEDDLHRAFLEVKMDLAAPRLAELSVDYVGKGEQNNGVPANHAQVKQVREPHQLPYPPNDEYSDHLAD